MVELEELQFDKNSSQLKSFCYYQDRQRFFPEKLIDRETVKILEESQLELFHDVFYNFLSLKK